MNRNEIIIKNVLPSSIAEEVGIEAGDVLLKINGNDIYDTIEYRFLICDEYLNLLIRKSNGEEWEIEVEKDPYDDLGIEFDDPALDNPRRCHNKCIFCFIDQLPSGMRESLYFKDDDSRLSFLQGNFVTLTNMNEEDIERIIKYRISPINVSVHTTNPELRVKMLNNKNAGEIISRIKKLTEGGISLNCQIVLCPGINDGNELLRTLRELFQFYPYISNVAVVPIGITKYRESLYKIESYNKESSLEVIKLVEKLQNEFIKKVNEPFVRLADEFYIMAEKNLPEEEHYGDFEQLEDGIGMIRYFEKCVLEDLNFAEADGKGTEIALITGTSCSKYIRNICDVIEKKLNIKINIYVIKNEFFGEKITVSGLITAGDIIKQLKGVIKEKFTLISSNMLKAYEDVFLDDITIGELEKILETRIIVCKYTGEDFLVKITDEVIECQNQ